MNNNKKYTAYSLLLLLTILVPSCVSPFGDRTSSASYSNNQTPRNATPRQPNSKNNLEKIVELTVDLPELQQYYHADAVADRKPLYILKNELITEEMSLLKFGESVKFADCNELKKTGKPYLEFVTLEIKEDAAAAVFRYRVEGVEGRLTFNKQSGDWQVQKQELVETDFTDKGCASNKN